MFLYEMSDHKASKEVNFIRWSVKPRGLALRSIASQDKRLAKPCDTRCRITVAASGF